MNKKALAEEEKMLEEIKEAVQMRRISGEFFKLSIIPYELNGEKGFNIMHSDSHKRVDFLTHKAACKWASVYFMVASTINNESLSEATDQ